MKKSLFYSLILTAGLTFVGCGNNDDDMPVVSKDGVISSQTDIDLDPNDLKGNVQANVTLSNTQTWKLTGALAVKSGFTLTIQAGTRIEAIVGGTNVYLVVEQGAKINAVGTATAPIRFTSSASNPRAGDWGGILINGFAKISGGGTSTTEVLPLTYGGTNDADDSGTMEYVIIEYTGARINGEKEFNGLTLYAVGSTTKISNIVINKGDDDAIEWFGGTVAVSNLLVIDARDDMFDWTQGWRSTGNSNWYGVRTADYTAVSEDTRGIEGDGNLDGNSPSDADQSNPTINNLTIINNGIVALADMVKIRRGSSATITNLYLGKAVSTPVAGDTIDLNDGKGTALASTSISGTVNVTNGVSLTDNNNPSGATITLTAGTTPSVNTSLFSWAGISF
jgi:hypothetical protein